MRLSLKWGLLAVLIATLWVWGAAQERLVVVVLAPQEGMLFGWAQQPPTVTIISALSASNGRTESLCISEVP